MKKYFLHLLVITATLIIYSCGSKQQDTESESDAFDNAQEEADEVSESLEGVIYNIPSPAEIPWLLEATGVEFDESLTNGYSLVDNYKTTFDVSALNMGIYAADLGYLSAYDKTQDAINYLTSMKGLADHLGVASAWDVEMLERFESNLGSKDSLYIIIEEGVENADKQLKNEDRSQAAALMTTGSFIEGLYIATQLIQSYPTDILSTEDRMTILTPLIRVVLEQEKSLQALLKLATSVPQDGMIVQVVKDLNGLDATFTELDIDEKIAQNQTDELLNDVTLRNLANQIAEMRRGIVE